MFFFCFRCFIFVFVDRRRGCGTGGFSGSCRLSKPDDVKKGGDGGGDTVKAVYL